jgi:signal transduction histidine kinase
MNALQGAVATVAIALSAFSLITYLWLGLTVLLLGNRRAPVTWIGGLGLLIAAVFFLCHGALVGAGGVTGTGPADTWWHLAWLPAFAAPLFWAIIGLHYVGMARAWGRLRILALSGAGALGLLAAILALVNWRAIATYGDFIRLLSASLAVRGGAAAGTGMVASPALPALGIAFVAYLGACAALPWAGLVARRFLPGMAQAAGAGQAEQALLWDAESAWSQARPALLAASLCMVVAGAVVGLVGILTAFVTGATRAARAGGPTRLPLPVALSGAASGHLPMALVVADLVVQSALTGLVLMLGWAVVRQGILVERRLPQRGFLGHWRGTVVVAGLVAGVVAGLALIEPDALPMLLVLLMLMAATYALFTWSSYAAHDRFLEQLRPFVDSLAPGRAGWLATSPGDVEQAVEALFTSLCRDVLGASTGRLALSAGHLHRTFVYQAPDGDDGARAVTREWVLPVADERGVVARLALGPRLDGAGYTTADLEVARACGQRILDAVGEFTAVQTIAQLARRRGLEAELSAALPRRKIHDDVLPRLHLAMLQLEGVRGRMGDSAREQAQPAGAARGSGAPEAARPVRGRAGTMDAEGSEADALAEVVQELGSVHRDLAKLLRGAPIANPRRLEHGLCAALRAALDSEFRGAFDTLTVEMPEAARGPADGLPDIVADLLLGATLEAVRNASRHARGGDLHRPLDLRLSLGADDRWVGITVADDGVGLQPAISGNEARAPTGPGSGALRTANMGLPSGDTPSGPMPAIGAPGGKAVGESLGASARSGLLTHSALLALVGGSLAVHDARRKGTVVTLRVPRVLESTGT